MKMIMMFAVTVLLLIGGVSLAQDAPIDPPPFVEPQGVSTGNGYTLSGVIGSGGGTSTGSGYTLSGTIGQVEANPTAASGGSYTLLGGFWPRLAALPGSPYDVNGDGYISPVDAVMVLNQVGQPLTNSNRFADVDGDEDIDADDAQAIIDRLGQIE